MARRPPASARPRTLRPASVTGTTKPDGAALDAASRRLDQSIRTGIRERC